MFDLWFSHKKGECFGEEKEVLEEQLKKKREKASKKGREKAVPSDRVDGNANVVQCAAALDWFSFFSFFLFSSLSSLLLFSLLTILLTSELVRSLELGTWDEKRRRRTDGLGCGPARQIPQGTTQMIGLEMGMGAAGTNDGTEFLYPRHGWGSERRI